MKLSRQDAQGELSRQHVGAWDQSLNQVRLLDRHPVKIPKIWLSLKQAGKGGNALVKDVPPPSRVMALELAPVRAALKLQAHWRLSDVEMLRICGLSTDDDGALAVALSRHFQLVDVRMRLKSLMAIRGRVSALVGGDAGREQEWLRSPWGRLNNAAPREVICSGRLDDLLRVESLVRELAGA